MQEGEYRSFRFERQRSSSSRG